MEQELKQYFKSLFADCKSPYPTGLAVTLRFQGEERRFGHINIICGEHIELASQFCISEMSSYIAA